MRIFNVKTSLIHALLIGVSVFMLTGCKKEPEAPKISQIFQTQILKLLESSTKLNAATSEGISYRDFSSMLDEVNGSFELSETMWSDGFAPSAKEKFAEAIKVWNFTEELWASKIKYSDTVAGDMDIVSGTYRGMSHEFKTAIPTEKWTSPYGGATYDVIMFSKVSACMSYASDKFEAARKELLAALN